MSLKINGKLAFDRILAPYFGDGFNPPSLESIAYSIMVLFAVFTFFSIIEDVLGKNVRKILGVFSFLGQHTLYTFMYHLLVKDIIMTCFPSIIQNIWFIRFFVFIPMIILPPLCVYLCRKFIDKWKSKVLEVAESHIV